ncbi:hypothetical protein BSK66_27805 [Paenibacillus odorifer]|uniref:hypothetical protein n=1 Tax=Paenibacillus TaxID=44249 RepID=UPI0003E23487|nr:MULTISPECIES: hypothetical protein [Paenibacillus]ETT53407.1 hypothetical protein C171_21259 [Paenibacillus sp. FSL H8-237]OMD13763.1 hypothetical protein BJP47_24355 [Paenibacillus odorifer]OME48993.1 hypothetical protein BSK66_27805 [Paenibacillus odorifer]
MLNIVSLKREIYNFKMYCNLTQDHLKSLDTDLRTGNLRNENPLEWIMHLDTYAHDLPLILNHSLLVSLFAFFENQLNLICEYFEEQFDISNKFRDYKGSGIKRAQTYLKKEVIQIDFPDSTEEWMKIKSCIPIRNCIVHCGGNVERFSKEKKKVEVRNSIDNFKIQEIFESSRNMIVIDKRLIFVLISAIDSVLTSLYNNELIK